MKFHLNFKISTNTKFGKHYRTADISEKLEILKFWKPFVICLLNSAANSTTFGCIWTKLDVLFIRKIPKGSTIS